MKNQNNRIVLPHRKGKIVQIKGCKKYCFVRLVDEEEINSDYQIDAFSPLECVDKSGVKKLKEGMLVEYDLVIHSKGYEAENARVLVEA